MTPWVMMRSAMPLSTMTLTDAAVTLALIMTSVAMFLALVRLVLGPSLPDRVVALDLIGTLSVGFIAAYDIATDQPILLDAATVVALVAFLATVAFAHYLERRARDD
ncbi:MAG TPA: cation:proton antiporter [Pirellulaceae bacterium]|nr:cation:proton antiporter [Pirellulaceae bacterium]